MPNIDYRLYFNNQPASREQLDQIEQITVEQEVNMAWEARLEIPLRVDEQGNWQGESEDFMQDFTRVRVEVRIGENGYVPLIDGPVVGYDSTRSSEPGQSSITVIVHDDSAFLNREDRLARFDDMTDSEIAAQVFGEAGQIAATDIEDTPPPAGDLPPSVVQRGTAIQILRSLARRQGMYAYVLPGDEPGQSVGCFKALPSERGDLPDMVLLGSERNIQEFDVSRDAQSPARVQAFALNVADKAVLTSTSNYRNLDLLGPEHSFTREEDIAAQVSLPQQGDAVDLDQRVNAEAGRASYDLEATGSLLSECYHGVLRPYQVLQVRGVNNRLSGDYVVSKATHTLTRSQYTQAFTVKRNAVSEGTGGDSADLLGGIW